MSTKPLIVAVDDIAEGVYMASGTIVGSDCYTTTARIHQSPETGRGDYRIQVDADHHADHNSNKQQFVITFNMPVKYVSSQGSLESGNGTTELHINLTYWNNHNDHIGLGDLVVTADAGLTILNAAMIDTGKC